MAYIAGLEKTVGQFRSFESETLDEIRKSFRDGGTIKLLLEYQTEKDIRDTKVLQLICWIMFSHLRFLLSLSGSQQRILGTYNMFDTMTREFAVLVKKELKFIYPAFESMYLNKFFDLFMMWKPLISRNDFLINTEEFILNRISNTEYEGMFEAFKKRWENLDFEDEDNDDDENDYHSNLYIQEDDEGNISFSKKIIDGYDTRIENIINGLKIVRDYKNNPRDVKQEVEGITDIMSSLTLILKLFIIYYVNITIRDIGVGAPKIRVMRTPVSLYLYPKVVQYGAQLFGIASFFGQSLRNAAPTKLKSFSGRHIFDVLTALVPGFIHGYKKDLVTPGGQLDNMSNVIKGSIWYNFLKDGASWSRLTSQMSIGISIDPDSDNIFHYQPPTDESSINVDNVFDNYYTKLGKSEKLRSKMEATFNNFAGFIKRLVLLPRGAKKWINSFLKLRNILNKILKQEGNPFEIQEHLRIIRSDQLKLSKDVAITGIDPLTQEHRSLQEEGFLRARQLKQKYHLKHDIQFWLLWVRELRTNYETLITAGLTTFPPIILPPRLGRTERSQTRDRRDRKNKRRRKMIRYNINLKINWTHLITDKDLRYEQLFEDDDDDLMQIDTGEIYETTGLIKELPMSMMRRLLEKYRPAFVLSKQRKEDQESAQFTEIEKILIKFSELNWGSGNHITGSEQFKLLKRTEEVLKRELNPAYETIQEIVKVMRNPRNVPRGIIARDKEMQKMNSLVEQLTPEPDTGIQIDLDDFIKYKWNNESLSSIGLDVYDIQTILKRAIEVASSIFKRNPETREDTELTFRGFNETVNSKFKMAGNETLNVGDKKLDWLTLLTQCQTLTISLSVAQSQLYDQYSLIPLWEQSWFWKLWIILQNIDETELGIFERDQIGWLTPRGFGPDAVHEFCNDIIIQLFVGRLAKASRSGRRGMQIKYPKRLVTGKRRVSEITTRTKVNTWFTDICWKYYYYIGGEEKFTGVFEPFGGRQTMDENALFPTKKNLNRIVGNFSDIRMESIKFIMPIVQSAYLIDAIGSKAIQRVLRGRFDPSGLSLGILRGFGITLKEKGLQLVTNKELRQWAKWIRQILRQVSRIHAYLKNPPGLQESKIYSVDPVSVSAAAYIIKWTGTFTERIIELDTEKSKYKEAKNTISADAKVYAKDGSRRFSQIQISFRTMETSFVQLMRSIIHLFHGNKLTIETVPFFEKFLESLFGGFPRLDPGTISELSGKNVLSLYLKKRDRLFSTR